MKVIDLLSAISAGLTVLAVFGLFHFNRVYRRLTGDTSYAYLSPNRWKMFGLVLRPQSHPELRVLRLRVLIVLGLWLLSAVVLLAFPLAPGR